MTRKRWKNPDKRMTLAVQFRHRGWSLRKIATELAVSEGTIRNDLRRADQHGQDGAVQDCTVIPLRNRLRNSGAQSPSDYASEITQPGGAS